MKKILNSSFASSTPIIGNPWEQYSRELANSRHDKARLVSFLPRNAKTVAEFGCGSGVLLSLISQFHPYLNIIGIDCNNTLINIANQKNIPNVKYINNDILSPDLDLPPLDAVFFCSVLHEVYSHNGKTSVFQTLKEAANHLKVGGRIIIRDTLKPPSKIIKLRFKNNYVRKRFRFFVDHFKKKTIEANFLADNLVELDMVDCFEFLFKYFYTLCWETEMEEIHGYFELSTFEEYLSSLGLKIIHKETYLLDFLENKWKQDFEMIDAIFPSSTFMLVAEKQE